MDLGNAGGGFRDFTRIAGELLLKCVVWRDITLANRDALLTEIAAYRNALDALALSIEHRRREGDRRTDHARGRRAPALGRDPQASARSTRPP